MSTSGNAQFQMVEERGWRRGLGNLLQGEFSSWTVTSSAMDTTPCGDFPIEDECCLTIYHRPVSFEFSDEAFTLYQGQERQVGDLTVRVSEAWAHGGKQTCPDYFCPRLRYMAYRSLLP